VEKLATERVVPIQDNGIRRCVAEMFGQQGLKNVAADAREYVMRHRSTPPGASQQLEQRVFVRLGASGFRYATAQTSLS